LPILSGQRAGFLLSRRRPQFWRLSRI